MVNELKLCKDCKWYKKSWFEHLTGSGDTFDLCFNPALTGNVVTGKNNGRYCDTMRRFHGCGVEGKYWEARK